MSYPKGSIASAITGSLPAPVVLTTSHAHASCWLQLHPRSKPRLTMLRQTNAPVAAAAWSSLRPSSAAPTRATEHRRQPPPSGSTPHDHDRCVATTKCQPCLLLVSDQPRDAQQIRPFPRRSKLPTAASKLHLVHQPQLPLPVGRVIHR